jgi:hypothetical protein
MFWAIAVLFHLLRPELTTVILRFDLKALLNVALCITAAALLVNPRSIVLLFALALIQIFDYFAGMPLGSNHYTMAFFLSSSIVASYLYFQITGGGEEIRRQAFYEAWASVGRYLLLIMYFFGIFHKINVDWFDPLVSCAVALTDAIVVPWNLKSDWLDQFVIYGTLIVEGLAIVFLCIPRLKYLGFLIGVPLHIIIGFTPYNWYLNYSSLVVALYVLFLPGDFPERLRHLVEKYSLNKAIDWVAQNRSSVLLFFVGVIGLAAAFVGISLGLGVSRKAFGDFYKLFQMTAIGIWALYSIPVYLLFMILLVGSKYPTAKEYWLARPKWMLAFPIIFLLNGFTPYFGLKTEATISMFSNLHTEASTTNHLLLDPPPYLFDYQKSVVKIHSSSDPYLQKVAAHGWHLVEFDFWSRIQRNPDMAVTYATNGEVRTLARAGDALPGHEQPWILRKFLAFKPVDFERPKVCSH